MPRPDEPRDPPDELRRAAREVEAEVEELGDPEGAPSLPSTTLATQATLPDLDRLADTGVRRSATGEVLHLAWPVMLSQALISLAGLIDRAMVGRLGGDDGAAIPLAAVGFATQFFFLLQSALFAVGLSCIALMARAIGARKPERARAALAASVEISLVTTLVLGGVILACGKAPLLWLGAEAQVADAALPYLQLVIGSSLLLAVALPLESALRANRDMRSPMWIALIITIAKLGGNWLLIYGNWGFPRLELVGAGLATVFSQAIAVLLFIAVIARAERDSPVAVRWADWRRGATLRREVIRIALPGISERIVMNVAMLVFFWVIGNYYGTVQVAAYTVGVALLSFSWIPGTGYAQACATLVGQALGADEPRYAERVGWRSARLALSTAIVLGIVVALARYPLARLFTPDEAVIAALGPFMLALAIAQPFLQLHFTLGGAHRGAGDTWTPLLAASAGNWIFRVPLAIFFAMVLEAPIMWVWCTLIVDHVARALWLTISFRRGRWIHHLQNP